MIFLNPAVLAVLAAAVAPIIIHFIYRQRKQYIDFGSIYFIKEIEKKKRIKTSWLEYLLLLLRVLTVACIVFAFSKPIASLELPFSSKEKQHYLISYYSGRELDITYKNSDIKTAMLNDIKTWLDQKIRNEDNLYLLNPFLGDI